MLLIQNEVCSCTKKNGRQLKPRKYVSCYFIFFYYSLSVLIQNNGDYWCYLSYHSFIISLGEMAILFLIIRKAYDSSIWSVLTFTVKVLKHSFRYAKCESIKYTIQFYICIYLWIHYIHYNMQFVKFSLTSFCSVSNPLPLVTAVHL